ncbi:MAG TPA: right-handed parallel beta-helix repeat-containing protein, partial [Kiritimatiellia bacterium]|nr:right-handed parallel beta-helix repeat-containing protein [Kiritimatiellia bacterium]
ERYNPETGFWETDTVHSAAIDFGNPVYSAANEPEPNGGRRNIGLHGNTWQASRSRTNLWLLALSYNDGGSLSAPIDSVYWTGNLTNGETVRIDLSGDGGSTWEVAGTGLLASAGTWLWSNTNLLSSRRARWRIMYEADTNVFDTCNTNFVFKTGGFRYYVNDASTNRDVYATAPGNDASLGTTSNAPKASLQAILTEYDLEPGDTVFIDTGTYNLSSNPEIKASNGGDSNDYVYIQGSTNGTVFIRNNLGSTYALYLNDADYVDISNMEFRRAGTGIYLLSADNINLSNVRAVSNATAGIIVNASQNVRMNRLVASLNGTYGILQSGSSSLQAKNCILWRNSLVGLQVGISSSATISNSIVAASGPLAYAYHTRLPNQILGDYNNLYAESNAVLGYLSGIEKNIDNLSEWISRTGQEKNSLTTDPLFANPQGGDFHLKTETALGRYVAGLGYVTNDAVTSPLIDAGNPAEGAPLEGGRKNIGLYGNTVEASQGRVDPWIYAATLEGGGIVSSTQMIHWVACNTTNGTTVDLEASVNGGDSWFALASGIPATNEIYAWNTTATNDSPSVLFRVVSPSVTDLFNEENVFSRIRNSGPGNYYVNDADGTDDMYTAAEGATNNWFATSNAPMSSLDRVLSMFNLEPGDRVYVDSGSYTAAVNAVVSRLDSGQTTNPVIIQGTTHEPVTQTVISREDPAADSYVLHLSGAENVLVRNLRLEGAGTGIRADTAGYVTLEQMQVRNNAGAGMDILNSTSVSVQRVISESNGGWGLQSSASS